MQTSIQLRATVQLLSTYLLLPLAARELTFSGRLSGVVRCYRHGHMQWCGSVLQAWTHAVKLLLQANTLVTGSTMREA
jgi:hypothetical protein